MTSYCAGGHQQAWTSRLALEILATLLMAEYSGKPYIAYALWRHAVRHAWGHPDPGGGQPLVEARWEVRTRT